MKRLRIAIVGAGPGRGQTWMATLKKLSELSDLYEFMAFVEVVESRAKENEAKWGVKAYRTLTELLERNRPDALLCAAAPDSNPMATGLAARYGVHVMLEIPIAPTLKVADWMIQTCQQNNVKLEVAEQVSFWATEQLKKKIITAGLIGKITHARLWYTNKADYHGLSGVRMLIGSEARRVLGFTGKVPVPGFLSYEGDFITEDVWDSAVIEFENGVVCLFEDPPRGRMSARWDLEGTLGQLVGNDLYIGSVTKFQHFPFKEEYTTIDGEKVLDHIRVDTQPPVVFENPYKNLRAADRDEVARVELLVGFHRAITQNAKPTYGPINARRDLEILYALRESARRGNVWVNLPLTEETELEKRVLEKFRELYGHEPHEVEALARAHYPRGGCRYKVAGWD